MCYRPWFHSRFAQASVALPRQVQRVCVCVCQRERESERESVCERESLV